MRYVSNDSTAMYGMRDKLLRGATCALLLGGGLSGVSQVSAQSDPISRNMSFDYAEMDATNLTGGPGSRGSIKSPPFSP